MRSKPLYGYTRYPMRCLGDNPEQGDSPCRKVRVLGWDSNKYLTVRPVAPESAFLPGYARTLEIKLGYVFAKHHVVHFWRRRRPRLVASPQELDRRFANDRDIVRKWQRHNAGKRRLHWCWPGHWEIRLPNGRIREFGTDCRQTGAEGLRWYIRQNKNKRRGRG